MCGGACQRNRRAPSETEGTHCTRVDTPAKSRESYRSQTEAISIDTNTSTIGSSSVDSPRSISREQQNYVSPLNLPPEAHPRSRISAVVSVVPREEYRELASRAAPLTSPSSIGGTD